MTAVGSLSVVATPIGNLGDITSRAAEVLGSVEAIACEDTRVTRKLLSLLGVAAPRTIVVNAHTEGAAVDEVVEILAGGGHVALVSDAGTPGISDPGARLVRACRQSGAAVVTVPGPSSVTAALSISGFPADRFVFEGFLPRRGAARAEVLAALGAERRTAVVLESPHRIVQTVGDLSEALGPEREVAVGRELTKRFEEVVVGPLSSVVDALGGREPRGEYVVVIDGAGAPPVPTDEDLTAAVEHQLAAGLSRRDAAAAVAEQTGVSPAPRL